MRYLGDTTDTDLLAAAQAVANLANACDLGGSASGNSAVNAFQQAWNSSSDTATTGGTQLTVDGRNGSQTASAGATVLGASSAGGGPAFPPACTSYLNDPNATGGGGGGGNVTPPPPPPGTTAIVASSGLPTWAKWLLGLALAGGLLYIGMKLLGKKGAGHLRSAHRHATRLHHRLRGREAPRRRRRRRK